MKRFFICAGVAFFLAATVGACDDGYDYETGSGWHGWEYCRRYDSCGSCTPVSGCGWCTSPSGAGVCVSQPDECPTEQFSWTWDRNGCLSIADAGVGVSSEEAGEDGAAPPLDSGTNAPDAGHEEVDSSNGTGGDTGGGDAAVSGAEGSDAQGAQSEASPCVSSGDAALDGPGCD